MALKVCKDHTPRSPCYLIPTEHRRSHRPLVRDDRDFLFPEVEVPHQLVFCYLLRQRGQVDLSHRFPFRNHFARMRDYIIPSDGASATLKGIESFPTGASPEIITTFLLP